MVGFSKCRPHLMAPLHLARTARPPPMEATVQALKRVGRDPSPAPHRLPALDVSRAAEPPELLLARPLPRPRLQGRQATEALRQGPAQRHIFLSPLFHCLLVVATRGPGVASFWIVKTDKIVYTKLPVPLRTDTPRPSRITSSTTTTMSRQVRLWNEYHYA